jgi:hypothetical protein
MPEHTTTPLPLLQAGVLPHPIKTAKHIWSIVQAKINMWSALAAARKNIPGFESLGDSMLLDQFADMYERINKAQASFTLSHIKDVSGLAVVTSGTATAWQQAGIVATFRRLESPCCVCSALPSRFQPSADRWFCTL